MFITYNYVYICFLLTNKTDIMKTRIKTVNQFSEKIDMAMSIQSLINSGNATKQDASIYNVLMSEIREFKNQLN